MDLLQKIICLHKNHQRNVWTKTGIHNIIRSAYFSHVSTQLLYSALHNFNLGTQDQKKNCLYVDDFGVNFFTKDDANHLLDYLKIIFLFKQIGRVAITSD